MCLKCALLAHFPYIRASQVALTYMPNELDLGYISAFGSQEEVQLITFRHNFLKRIRREMPAKLPSVLGSLC
jgi:hypothetical protein